MNVLTALLNLLFPPKCPFCRKVLDAPGICPKCEKTIPWIDGEHIRRELEPGLVCVAPLWYQDGVREGLRRFKFHGAASSAGPLGELLGACAEEYLHGRFDTVTWAPVSAKRLRKRGYDQARLLAENACKAWGIQPTQLLKKKWDNAAQSSLDSAEARRINTRLVYASTRSARGKRVLLIDDICTTGSTLIACAEILRAAGAEDVVCAAVAFPKFEDSLFEELGEKMRKNSLAI